MAVTARASLSSLMCKFGVQLSLAMLRLLIRDPTFRHGLQLLGRSIARRHSRAAAARLSCPYPAKCYRNATRHESLG